MKVIITDCDHKDIAIETAIFTTAGIEYELKHCQSEADVIEQCGDATVLIIQYAPLTASVFAALPQLKMVVRYGVGVDTIDINAATKYGVQICNVPDYGMNEVADHAIALLMAMTRKIIVMDAYTRNKKWDFTKAIPIHRNNSQIVGVVGLGRIGRNFAAKAQALGFQVIGYDPYYKETPETKFIKACTFAELVATADIISLHCPAEGNKNLFNMTVFKAMKNSALLINVARGGIINEQDLYDALKSGEISGAAIDCVECEPMQPGNQLYTLPNYIATPHMAWYSEEAAAELKRKVAEESVRFLLGEAVHYPINKLSNK